MLHAHRESILGKLLGIKQQSFGMRCWDNLCAVSSSAIIDRDSIPSDVSKQLVKTEFLVDILSKTMKLKTYAITKLNPFDTRPDFNDDELKSITSFLMAQLGDIKNVEKEMNQEVVKGPVKTEATTGSILQCKSCGEKSDYSAQHGRYGYFIKCNKCETNTSMKIPCVSCGSKNTKVSKKKKIYTLSCSDCEQKTLLI
jgi:transcription elongation factor Elf1